MIKNLVFYFFIALFFGLIFYFIQTDSELSAFLKRNSSSYFWFFIFFCTLLLVTGLIYYKSLDDYDQETRKTVNASKINIAIWAVYWICWSIYNAILLLNQPSAKTFVFSFLVTNVPGIVLYMITFSFRNEQISERTHLKGKGSITIFEGDDKPYSFVYYSGFYGILCIPLYTITLLILF